MSIIDEWTQKVMLDRAVLTEEKIRSRLRPQPRWLPMFIWRRVVARMLVIETETRRP